MYTLLKDNLPVFSSQSDFDIIGYFHKHSSFSLSWGIKFEGYKVFHNGVDVSKDFI